MTGTSKSLPVYQRVGWVFHTLATALLSVSALYLLTTPDEKIIGIITSGFAILGLLLSLGAFRQGREYAWVAMWVYPATLGALGLFFILGGGMGLGGYYLGLALMGVLGQALSYSRFKDIPN